MQWCSDMNLTTILGVWAGLHLDGEIISEADIQPYVDSVMNELEFLLVSQTSIHDATIEAELHRAILSQPTVRNEQLLATQALFQSSTLR